ncbi:hypothetical protein DICPUDRAFT_158833 [Dictyostelium purpureum]|uniref:Uncharacterized protein n=1 Tax=Dictyostelium purpureum TaxID=5786 RepID=F1A2L6_DICPU|nr:uncharacterized protein DICPUDRAFT_158833 [Dictyostelium purpureum]EGC29561.1 hypothetical protein DICPUDRAFT_158833 [Dictyostelium purpureum]|eukprot:XP_003293910.1 hypothetical protein DICPUDRAFT_158833 [Dictyostelium purpureum]
MNQNKRTNNQTIRKTVEEFKWSTKDSSFKNVYKNYQNLCNLFNTPIEIFNDNLTSLDQTDIETDYSNVNLEFFGCSSEHIGTIKVSSIFSSTYDVIKTNIKCKYCDRENLLKGLSTLYSSGCISSSLYSMATNRAKQLDTDGVSQFKLTIANTVCDHSKELVGSQIIKLSDSHLDCDECLKMGNVASRIIEDIDFHIKSKSFSVNSYEELIKEISLLDAYSIQSYEFIVKLPCGHDRGIKNSFIYYNGKRNIDFLCQVCKPQVSTIYYLNLLESYMKMNSLIFYNQKETIKTFFMAPIRLIKDIAVTFTREKCGHHYGFKLSSLSFNHFYSNPLQCKECSLNITLYESIKTLLKKYPSLESKTNFVEIKKLINESEDVRNINFYFQMSCGHEICISGSHLINYKSISPCCPQCNPDDEKSLKFSFYGFKRVNVEHSQPEFICPKGHIMVNPSKWICRNCNIRGQYYEKLVMDAVNKYLQSNEISEYVQLLTPESYSFSDLNGYFDFSIRFKLDSTKKQLLKLNNEDPQKQKIVVLNFQVDELYHFSKKSTIQKDSRINYYHSMNRGKNLARISYRFIEEMFHYCCIEKAIQNFIECSIYSVINFKQHIIISDDIYEELESFKNRDFKFFNLFDLFLLDGEFPLENWSLKFDFSNLLKK